MKKYIIAIITVSVAIVICTVILFAGARPKNPPPVDYTIYIYETGAAEIEVSNIADVIQTHEDLILDDMVLKAGTIILPGNGNEIYYEYPRHDKVLKEGDGK